MKIRIMSDLHLDVNEKYPLYLPDEDKDTFTILAGDTAGEIDMGVEWVKENCPNGVCIAGNHIVYNNYGLTLQDLKQSLKEDFPLTSSMKFLDNDSVELNDNIIIVGTTLYTDYALYRYKFDGSENEGWLQRALSDAKRFMNDFKWGLYDTGETVVELMPEHYLEMFNKSLEYIKNVCESNPDKQIIVVTHHAPSSESIHQRYQFSRANDGYASHLDDFILNHPNIKAWIHGHVHDRFNYMIGNCRVICNPRGYVGRMEDMNWNPCFYLDTETWETSSDESWFKRKKTKKEIKNRKALEDAYDTLFKFI